MFNYNPKDAKKLFEAGDYCAELTGVEEKVTKTGKPMLVVNLQIHANDDGPSILLRDWIVAPDSIWKLQKLANALGVVDKFEDQSFNPEDYKGCNIGVTLKVRVDEKYGEQNTVVGYKPFQKEPSTFVKRHASGDAATKPVFAETPEIDQECPF